MTDEKPEARKPRPSRKAIIRWGLVIAGVAVAGALLYRPLRTRYAIWRVKRGDTIILGSGILGPTVASENMLVCLRAACAGNAEAMELVIDHPDVLVDMPIGFTSTALLPPTLAFEAASGNPELLFRVLDERDDKHAFRVLWWVSESNSALEEFGGGTPCYRHPGTPGELVRHLKRRCGSTDFVASAVAKPVLAYACRRFSKELDAAEAMYRDALNHKDEPARRWARERLEGIRAARKAASQMEGQR